MVLVDTSVWIDHLRNNNALLAELLQQSKVFIHPMIIGELACGNLKNRQLLISLWHNLPTATEAHHSEALYFLEHEQLMGKGIGYIDLHLLAATRLSQCQLWTFDKRLSHLAQQLRVQYQANE